MDEKTQLALINEMLRYQRRTVIDVRRASGYAARQEIERLQGKYAAHPKRLEPFGYKVYSQNDEDGILHEIFRRIGVDRGVFCEIGVENGLENNSLFLLHKGWTGLWLEGNEAQLEPIRNKFATLIENERLTVKIQFVTPENINELIRDFCVFQLVNPDQLDFLSIDIDGMDIYVMRALHVKPKVICIEYNAKFPAMLRKVPVFNPSFQWAGEVSDYMGSSLAAIAESAQALGYSLVATNLTGCNAFFVRNDLLGDHFHDDLTPEALYNPPRYYLYEHFYVDGIGHAADFGPYVDLIDPVKP
jgi:hypothetical protein